MRTIICFALVIAVVHALRLPLSRVPHTFSTEAPVGPLGVSFRAGSTIPINGGFLTLGGYYTSIMIGTPGVNFTVLVDTGSSNVAVPGANCGSSCGKGPTYSVADSSTGSYIPFKSDTCAVCSPEGNYAGCIFGPPISWDTQNCGFGITYGGGSSAIGGSLVTDTICWGDNCVTAPFGEIEDNIIFGWDGILGLASVTNACNPTCVTPIFDVWVQNGLAQDIFGICFSPANGGYLDMGSVDTSKFTAPLQWVPITADRWYNFNVQDVQVGTTSIGLPSFAYAVTNDVIGTFVDSGTSIILMAPATFTYYTNTYQATYPTLKGVTGDSNLFTGQCYAPHELNPIDDYPSLTVIAAGENGMGVPLTVPPAAYLVAVNGTVCLGVQAVPGIGMVLGDVFMENFYIVHDRANMRLGFAPLGAGGCAE